MATLAENEALWRHLQERHNFGGWTRGAIFQTYGETLQEIHDRDHQHRSHADGHIHPLTAEERAEVADALTSI